MKRESVLVGLGLLVGLGVGYALGRHSPVTAPAAGTGAPSAVAAAPAGAPHARHYAGPETPAAPAATSAADARRQLAAWVAAGCPEKEFDQLSALLEIWSTADPAAALDFVFTAPRFPGRKFALAIPLAAICRRSPEETINWLHAHLPEQDRGEVAQSVIQQLCEKNPREALVLAEADQIPVAQGFFGQIFRQLVRTSPAEALAAFSRLSDEGRANTAMALANAWAETDPAAALQWAESLGDKPGAVGAKRGVVRSLVEHDPDQALQLLGQWGANSDLVQQVVRMTAYQHPELILNNLSLIPAAQRAEALSTAARESFASQPDQIAALASANLPAAEAQKLVGSAWTSWLEQDRPAAEAWAATVQDPALRAGLELVKLKETARSDPSLFLSTVENLPIAQSEQPLIQSALTHLNPDQAGDWISRHPSAVTPEFAAQIASEYFTWNRDQAIAWVNQLPAGTSRDQAFAGLAERWTSTGDADAATRSLATIANPQLQTGARFRVFTTLYQKDQAAAARWLAAQPLSAEIRANWQALADTGRNAASEPEDLHFDY